MDWRAVLMILTDRRSQLGVAVSRNLSARPVRLAQYHRPQTLHFTCCQLLPLDVAKLIPIARNGRRIGQRCEHESSSSQALAA